MTCKKQKSGRQREVTPDLFFNYALLFVVRVPVFYRVLSQWNKMFYMKLWGFFFLFNPASSSLFFFLRLHLKTS